MKALMLSLIHKGFKDLYSMDLSGMDLSGVDFAFCNLSEVDFTGSILDGCRFSYSNLVGAIFSGNTFSPILTRDRPLYKNQNLYLTYFCGADLSGVDLSGLCLDEVCFDGATLVSTSFRGSSLKKASFQNISKIRGSDILPRIVIQDVDFSAANLNEADFYQAKVQRSDFSAASLEGVDFTYASISSSRFSGAVFKGCTFSQTELWGCIIPVDCGLPSYEGRFHRPTLYSWSNHKHAARAASEETIEYWANK